MHSSSGFTVSIPLVHSNFAPTSLSPQKIRWKEFCIWLFSYLNVISICCSFIRRMYEGLFMGMWQIFSSFIKEWCPAAAENAQNWANRCTLSHSPPHLRRTSKWSTSGTEQHHRLLMWPVWSFACCGEIRCNFNSMLIFFFLSCDKGKFLGRNLPSKWEKFNPILIPVLHRYIPFLH